MHEYTYKAFISYRHMSLDKKVAEKLQKMLEEYKPPKEMRQSKENWRIFRDETELPTSSNLSDDIKTALHNSEYLIIICSKATAESRWCLEEITQFKALHNGTNENIITLLIDGKPDEVFPKELCTTTKTEIMEDGTSVTSETTVEPLAANIVADTPKETLKKLNTEFLRIVAPLLGCGYDDLYNRNHRRKVRRLAAGVAAAFIGITIFSIYSSVMLMQINNQKNQLQAKNEELELRTQELNTSNNNLEKTNKELDGANSELDKKNQELDDANTELDASNTQLESKNAELDKTNSALTESNKNLDKANSDLKQTNSRLDSANTALTKSNESLEIKTKEAEDNLVEANIQREAAEANLDEANRQKEIAESNMEEANKQKELAESNMKEANKQKELAEENMRMAQKNEAKANEQTKLTQIENSENLSKLSQTLWDNGNGIEAVKTVLSALPTENDSRPVVPTAEKILANEMNAFDKESFRSILSIKHDKSVSQIGYAGNGTSIVTRTSDGIYFWDSQNGNLKKSYINEDTIPSYSTMIFENEQIIESSYLLNKTGGSFMMNEDGVLSYEKSSEDEVLVSSDDVFVFYNKNIIKFDGKTGNIIWNKNIDSDIPSDERYYSSDSKLVGNYVVAHCYSGTDDKSLIILYNSSDGELVAKYTIEYKFKSSNKDNWIYFTDNKAYCFDITYGFTQGSLISFDIVEDNLVNPTVLYEHYNDNTADAVLEEYKVFDGTLYALFSYDLFGTFDRSNAVLQAYDLSSGTLIWSRDIDNVFGSSWFGQYAKIGKIAADNANNCCNVIFAATSKKMILFNADDGSILSEYDYNDRVINSYYSLNGMIYLITGTGKELAFAIRNNDSIDRFKNTSNFVTHQLNIELSVVGYCNNNYAVCTHNSNMVYVFRDIENKNFNEIFNAGESSVKSVKLNSSGKFALITAYSKEESVKNVIYVYDTENDVKSELLRSSQYISYVEFIDENKICILNGKKLSFIDIVSGEEIVSFNDDESLYIFDYGLSTIHDGVVFNGGTSLTFYKEPGITRWEPKRTSQNSFKGWEEGYIRKFYVSPADKILATVMYYGEQSGKRKLELYNIGTNDSIILNTDILNEDDKIDTVGCAWSDDSVSVCFNNGQIETFNVYSGECISTFKTDIVPCAVAPIGKNLITIFANDYSLYKINVLDGSVLDSISLSSNGITDSYNKNMRYVADRNILIVEASYDGNWIIDLDSFKVRYEVEYFADYNPIKNIVALQIYNYAGICPLYTTNELINIGNDYLGIKE